MTSAIETFVPGLRNVVTPPVLRTVMSSLAAFVPSEPQSLALELTFLDTKRSMVPYLNRKTLFFRLFLCLSLEGYS